MSLNRTKLTQAEYRERYSGLELLFDVTRSVRACAETIHTSQERVSLPFQADGKSNKDAVQGLFWICAEARLALNSIYSMAWLRCPSHADNPAYTLAPDSTHFSSRFFLSGGAD